MLSRLGTSKSWLAALALVIVAAACTSDPSPTTVSIAPSTSAVAIPPTTLPASTTTVATTTTTTNTTTTTTTTTLPPPPTTTPEPDSGVTTTTLSAEVDGTDPCAVFDLFARAVDAADTELAFSLVHPFATGQPPLGLAGDGDRFVDHTDPSFTAYATDVAGETPQECRFVVMGESFSTRVGAVELTAGGSTRAVPMRTDEDMWKIDELTDHVVGVAPPLGTVQPSFASPTFTTPLGTFDVRLQVDGADVVTFAYRESSTDPERFEVVYTAPGGFPPGDHSALLITMLENGLVDAETVYWSVP